MKRLNHDWAPLSAPLPGASASAPVRVVSVEVGAEAGGPRRTVMGVFGLVVGVDAVGVPLLPGCRDPARDAGDAAPGAEPDEG